MEFTYIEDGIDAIVIDNFYSENQLKEIMIELKWLTKKDILLGPEQLHTAETITGGYAAKKNGVFLETVFANWQHSALIKHAMANFTKEDVKKTIQEYNSLYRLIYSCDTRAHLLSYYENGGFYAGHSDATVFTILNWFSTLPQQFTGGNMTLFSSNSSAVADIEFKNNRVLIIPGCAVHEVKEIKSNVEEYSGDGRYCNAIFLTMRADPPKKKDRNDSN
jgi:hypothetical protein